MKLTIKVKPQTVFTLNDSLYAYMTNIETHLLNKFVEKKKWIKNFLQLKKTRKIWLRVDFHRCQGGMQAFPTEKELIDPFLWAFKAAVSPYIKIEEVIYTRNLALGKENERIDVKVRFLDKEKKKCQHKVF